MPLQQEWHVLPLKQTIKKLMLQTRLHPTTPSRSRTIHQVCE